MDIDKASTLYRQAKGLVYGFILQLIIGMVLNMYTKLPTIPSWVNTGRYITRSWHSLLWSLGGEGGWALAVHAYLALGLVFGLIGLLISSIKARHVHWSWVSGSALLCTLGAFFAGLGFVSSESNAYSLAMAVFWLFATAILIFGISKKGN